MANVPFTQLDPGQVIKQAYNEQTRKIMVDAAITAPDGTSVLIDATTDSIKIGNTATGPFLHVNNDGSINVDVVGAITATNPSVGVTGVTAPASATEMGAVDSGGKLQSLTVDPSGKLLVDITGTSTVTGTVNASIEGLNAFKTSQQVVGTSTVQLTVTPLTNRSSMSVKADSANTASVLIGNSNAVTTSTGYAIFAGDSLQLDLTPAQAMWAISSLANQLVYVLEIGG